MKHFKDFTDDVSGTIVGTWHGRAWVTYDGRKQGAMCYPENEADAYAQCEAIKSQIKEECGPEHVFKIIYPLDSWMFHFDGI